MLYLLHYGIAGSDQISSHETLSSVFETVRSIFRVSSCAAGPEFLEQMWCTYESFKFTGLSLHVIDQTTGGMIKLDVSEALDALGSHHAKLPFEADIRSILSTERASA